MLSLPPAPNRACPQPGETIDSHTERNSQASPPSHPTIKQTQLAEKSPHKHFSCTQNLPPKLR